jgi:dCMP deaminase
MDLIELEEMYSNDPEVRAQFLASLPVTITRGEYDRLLSQQIKRSTVSHKDCQAGALPVAGTTFMNGRKRAGWGHFAMSLAKAAAERSEDPHVQVGACVLRHDMSVGGVGYNGAPPGVDVDWSDREARLLRVVHAEVNALAYVRPGECGCIAVTLLPCRTCLTLLARYGIKIVWYGEVYKRDETALTLAEEFGIKLYKITGDGLQNEPSDATV